MKPAEKSTKKFGCVKVKTQVEEVTLYPDGAKVIRCGKAKEGWVQITDLPLRFEVAALRILPERGVVEAKHETCAVILPRKKADLEKVKSNAARLEKMSSLLAAKKELEKWALFLEEQQVRRPKTSDDLGLLPAVEMWAEFDEEILLEREKVQKKLRMICDDIEKYRDEINFQAAGEPTFEEVPKVKRGLQFLLTGEGEIIFRIEYAVRGARWVPSYRLDLKSNDDKIALLRTMALCANASGEDWSGAEIFLSSAQMQKKRELPELLSWRMGRKQPREKPAFRILPVGLDALFQSYDLGKKSALSSDSKIFQSEPSGGAPVQNTGFDEGFSDEEAVDVFGGSLAESPLEQMASEAAVLMDAGEMLDAMNELEDYVAWDDDCDEELADELESSPAALCGQQMPTMSASAMPEIEMSRKMRKKSVAPARGRLEKEMSRGDDVAGYGAGTGFFEAAVGEESLSVAPWRHDEMHLGAADHAHFRGRLHQVGDDERLLGLLGAHSPAERSIFIQALLAAAKTENALLQGQLPYGTYVPDPDSAFVLLKVPDVLQNFSSDGRFHRVNIASQKEAITKELRAIARGGEEVFRFCRLENQSLQMPRGPLQVFEDGVFLVESELFDAPGIAKREIGLGIEPSVLLKNRVVHVSQEEKGIMSSESHVEHEVRFEVVSSSRNIQEIMVFDRLPWADESEKQIQVVLLECEPQSEEIREGPSHERVRGGLKWRLVLEPGEVRKVVYRYRISLPAKEELVGGNRREH